MAVSSSDVKRLVSLRRSRYGIMDSVVESVMDFYIQAAVMELLGTNHYRELLKTVYGNTDEKGYFTVKDEIIPYQYYWGGSLAAASGTTSGIIGSDHSWLRVTPIQYDYFERFRSGNSLWMFNAANASRKRRYTVIPPESQPETTLAILEVRAIVPVKLIYTKQTADVADLPDYCTTVIVDIVCRRLIDDFGGQSSEGYKKSLDMRIDSELRLTRNKLNKIENSIQNMTVKNRLVRNYLDSEVPFDTFVKFR